MTAKENFSLSHKYYSNKNMIKIPISSISIILYYTSKLHNTLINLIVG